MKVYVLAHCYGEGNNAEPRVFTTYEAAKNEFDLDIEDWWDIFTKDTEESIPDDDDYDFTPFE